MFDDGTKEIVFQQTVTPSSIEWLFEQCANQRKIRIYLNSSGGESSGAFAFYEYMRVKKIELHVHILNTCMSSAIIILCAASKRTAASYARFLFHPAKIFYKDASFLGQELDVQTKDLSNITLAYNQIVGLTTTKGPDAINDLCNKQTLLSTQEALDLGLLTDKSFEIQLLK